MSANGSLLSHYVYFGISIETPVLNSFISHFWSKINKAGEKGVAIRIYWQAFSKKISCGGGEGE